MMRPNRASLAYPPARRSHAVRTFHGQSIPDPYDWLGGPQTPEIAAWTAAQEALTEGIVGGAERDRLESWLTATLSRPHSFRVAERGEHLFVLRDELGRDQPALFVQTGKGTSRLVFDPGTLEPKHSHAIMQQSIRPSPDGRHVALAVAPVGNDAQTILLIETATGRLIDGTPPKTVVPTIDWHPQGRGFFYNRNQGGFVDARDRMTSPEGVYWHSVGTPFADDALVCRKAWNPAHVTLPAVSADGKTLFVSDVHLVAKRVALALHKVRFDGNGPKAISAQSLITPGDGFALYLGDEGNESFFETEFGDTEPRRIVAIDRTKPERTHWRSVIDEGADAIALTSHALRSANAVVSNGKLYVTHLHDAYHRLAIYSVDGRYIRDVPLPSLCSMAGPGGERYGEISVGGDGKSLLFELWTHTHRQLPVRYRPEGNATTWIFPAEIDEAALRTRVTQIFCEATDGARIPVFILEPDDAGPRLRPTLLYGYGGFGASITPEFSPDIPAWLKLGGRYAIANIRGGGEYGKTWHEAGRRRNRQTVFDDFCAVAAALVERGYATRDSLAIRGISNGGLLTGACAMQRPELFGAVISELPLLDGLALGGDPWSQALEPEYGNPVSDERDFEAIRKWSPLHSVHGGVNYPPIFVLVAEKDSATLLDGGRKFIATLQAAAPDMPALFRLVPGCGHTGWPRSATVRTIAEEIVFIAKTLDVQLDWAALDIQKGGIS